MSNRVFIPDLHGHCEYLERVVNYYDRQDPATTYHIMGDVLDKGPDVKETLDLIRDLGERAHTNIGNHEYVLRASLTEHDPYLREQWQQVWLEGDARNDPYEDGNTLKSYGIEIEGRESKEDIAKALLEKMQELGHWSILEKARLFYSDLGTVAVHAGLSETSELSAQLDELGKIASAIEDYDFQPIPTQLVGYFSNLGRTANNLKITLVTGHVHLQAGLPITERVRIFKHGKHISLASDLDNDALYVWDDGDQEVKAFMVH